MDIDVEHEGQRTKVTPTLQNERAEEELGGGANTGGGASVGGGSKSESSSSDGTKVGSSDYKNETDLMDLL